MSGNSRRTGKAEAVRQLVGLTGVDPPDAAGGTIPAAWLRDLINVTWGEGAVGDVSSKRGLLRRAITLAGGAWSDEFMAPGSTVPGEALWMLHQLLSAPAEGHPAKIDAQTARQSTLPGLVDPVAEDEPAGPDEPLVVQIRPKVGMYSAFARLNYKPWYAIAEFVDNALQSFLANRAQLSNVGVEALRVEVSVEHDCIRITDNAAGIFRSDMDRAFAPALPPMDRSGLSEFGIGMKAAACWFANHWSVRTSALGEPVERRVVFDVPTIVDQGSEHLVVREDAAPATSHFTVLELTALRTQPQGRTLSKICEHLASIYRNFIRDGLLELHFRSRSIDRQLSFAEPEFLVAAPFREPTAEPVQWRKAIDIDVGQGQRIWGWAGLLAKASTKTAGFAIFRRRRLIEGSADESWRPRRIFKAPNSYTYQRLVGELQVEGFNVSHTKDGIQWGDHEDDILDLLRYDVDSDELPLIRQAEGYRVAKPARELQRGFGQSAVDTTGDDLSRRAAPILRQQLARSDDGPSATPDLDEPDLVTADRVITVEPSDDNILWRIRIQVVRERAAEWYSFSPPRPVDGERETGRDVRAMTIRLNLDHPFSEHFINESEKFMAPILRIVAGLALAETTALEITRPEGRVDLVRRNFNELLRDALSKEGD